MSRGYTVLLYCTSLLLDVTVGRCFTLAVVLLTYTVLLLVIVFNNDGSRGPTDILLQYCISALDTVLLSEHTRHVQCSLLQISNTLTSILFFNNWKRLFEQWQ